MGIEAKGELRNQPAQLPDIMATFLDITGIEYPSSFNGRKIKPLEGFSMMPTFSNEPHKRKILFWEHEGNKAVRKGKWKLVCKYPGDWELYDMVEGRTELSNLSNENPEVVKEMIELYNKWAERCEVTSWKKLLDYRKKRKI